MENWQNTKLSIGTNRFEIQETLQYLVISPTIFLIKVSPQTSLEPYWEVEHENSNLSSYQINSINFKDKENLRPDLQLLQIQTLAIQILQKFIQKVI